MATCVGQSSRIDSLVTLLRESPNEKKIDIYQQIIISLWLNHPDSAMIFAKEALAFSNGKDTRTRAIAVRLVGGVYYYKGIYDSTITYSNRAYYLALELKDSALMSNSLNNMGLSYYSVGSYPEGLEFLLRSLDLKKRTQQRYGLEQTLNNIGLIYLELKNYDKALEYHRQALQASIKASNADNQMYSLNNIGEAFLRKKMLDSAGFYYSRAYEVGKTTDNVVWNAATRLGLGDVAFEKANYPEAHRWYREGMKLSEAIDEKSGIATAYASIAEIYLARNFLDSARYFLNTSQRVAKAIRARDLELANLELLKTLFSRQKKYDSALYYADQHRQLKDSLFDENLARNISGIQQQMQEEESMRILADKDAQIRQTKVLIYSIASVAGLVVVFSVLLFRAYRTHKKLSADLSKQNKEITEQKEEISSQKEALQLSHAELEAAQEKINQQNRILSDLNVQLQSVVNIRTKELEAANQQLKLVNLELDNFIYKSSHDIKGPLVRLLGVCHAALLDVNDEKAREYFTMLNETAQNLNDIFDRLKIVSEIHEMEIQYKPIDLQEIVRNVENRLAGMEGFSGVEFRHQIDTDTTWQSDPFLVETILHNMIENAVKFHKKSGVPNKFIDIKARKQDRKVLISITDNGIGIKDSDTEHIFKMFSKAALEHKTVGLGLYIVKESVSKLKGEVRLVQNDQKHTEFEVSLPA